MMLISLSLSLALSSLAYAAPFTDTPLADYAHKVKEVAIPPRGWIKRGAPPADYTIELRIALPQPNFSELERHLYEVSDPTHYRYGEYLSKGEVEELIAPHPESLNSVHHWLATHGFTDDHLNRSPASDWIKVNVPVSLAEKMLNTEYHVWVHEPTGKTAIRTTTYSLPETLHHHIELVHPTIHFPSTKPLVATSHLSPILPKVLGANVAHARPIVVPSASGGHVDADCNNNINIKCLQQIYNIGRYKSSAHNGSRIGITGYLEQFANIEDLQSFYKEQRPDAVGSSFDTISVHGGLNNQSLAEAGVEANLDTQFAFGLTFPTPGVFYSTAGRPPIINDLQTPDNTNEPYQDWLDYVLDHPNPPQVVSTSYGDDEQTVPESYARRICQGLAQLGARGVSVFFSSGDFGVGDGDPNPETQICKTNDGRNVTRFMPAFPASCPYVTTIGGTVHIPEVAIGFSGGGFSDLFPRPAYQDSVVSGYLKNLPEGIYAGLFNSSGRAYPDLAAQSSRYVVWVGGHSGHVGGTSASSPTVAAIFSLLNDVRISHGLSPLGFLNPLIYKIQAEHPEALNDITEGNNPGCGTQGFNATKGWDPVTGLGTPNFGKLKDLVLSLK